MSLTHGPHARPRNSKGTIVAMDHYRPRSRRSPLRQLEAYWTALTDDHPVPNRSAIDPRGLEDVLKYAFILERVTPEVTRFRVAGQQLYRSTGLDLRGMSFSSLFAADMRSRMMSDCAQVFETPSILTAQLVRTGATIGVSQLLLLPLRDESGKVNRALGGLVDQTDQVAPVRYEVIRCDQRPVGTCAAPAPSQHEQGFAEPHVSFDESDSHLRIVASRD